MPENQPDHQPGERDPQRAGNGSPFAAGAPTSMEPASSGASGVTVASQPDHTGAGPVVERAEVERVIEVIRPAIQADNGDIVLVGVDEASGVVTVELIGACVSCPASTVTLKAGIERILKDRVPGVTEVVDAGQASSVLTETSVSL